jgi:hypothetical protein
VHLEGGCGRKKCGGGDKLLKRKAAGKGPVQKKGFGVGTGM